MPVTAFASNLGNSFQQAGQSPLATVDKDWMMNNLHPLVVENPESTSATLYSTRVCLVVQLIQRRGELQGSLPHIPTNLRAVGSPCLSNAASINRSKPEKGSETK